MWTSRRSAAALTALILVLPTGALPQDFSYGERLFRNYCAECHGETGVGDGPAAEGSAVRPRDLTRLSKDNGGVFPFVDIYQAIDGRRAIRGHGSDMPVWGELLTFEAESFGDLHLLQGGFSAEDIVQARILAIVYYLQTLQQR